MELSQDIGVQYHGGLFIQMFLKWTTACKQPQIQTRQSLLTEILCSSKTG